MTPPDKNVVRKELMISASQKRAFQTFTDGLDLWWPRAHHIGKAELKRAVLEAKANGRWYEIGVDGSECDWGRVLVWNPPHKIVLAWQITAAWQYDPNFLTEVEVNFVELGPNLTQFTLEHRNIDRFGEKAPQMWSAFDSDGGWGGLSASFAKAAEASQSGREKTAASI
jgi:uncharacterized protein YndB with AHSA1/START domain